MACRIDIETIISPPLCIGVDVSRIVRVDTEISPHLDIDQNVLPTRIEVEHKVESHPIIECYAICKPNLSYENFVLSDGQVFMTINSQHFKVKKQNDYGIFK